MLNKSKFGKVCDSSKEFIELAKMYGSDGSFISAIGNIEIDGISLSNLEAKDVIEECCNNPWYYFREILGLEKFTSADILALSLILKGWTVIRVGNDPIHKSFFPGLLHYMLRFGNLNKNLGAFITGDSKQRNMIDSMRELYVSCVDGADSMMHCNSYAVNEYTGRFCRVQPAAWALANGKYTYGVFDVSLDTPGYIKGLKIDGIEYDECDVIMNIKGINKETPYTGNVSYYRQSMFNGQEDEILTDLYMALDCKDKKFDFKNDELFSKLNQTPDENIICVI